MLRQDRGVLGGPLPAAATAAAGESAAAPGAIGLRGCRGGEDVTLAMGEFGSPSHVHMPAAQLNPARHFPRFTISPTIAVNCSVSSCCRNFFDITAAATPAGSISIL